MLPIVRIERDEHRGQARLFLHFKYHPGLIALVKQVSGARWSGSQRAWHIPDRLDVLGELLETLEGKATIDQAALHTGKPPSPQPERVQRQAVPPPAARQPRGERRMQQEALAALRKYMEHKRYARSTVENYLAALSTFLEYTSKPDIRDIGQGDVVDFVHGYILKKKMSQSYQNTVISALKLLFREVYHTRLEVEDLERPRREKRLPNVLSKEEVRRILDAPRNLKHRLMLAMLYGCGLRRSELLNLRQEDIEAERGVMVIRQSKGKKDRVVPLPVHLRKMLDDYYRAFRPEQYVFEGQRAGQPYSATSIEKVLSRACEQAGISKPVTLHWLRHSYATHLLERGVDLRYIQELLGHQSSRTTEIYTHVTFKSLQNIRSPLDDLDE